MIKKFKRSKFCNEKGSVTLFILIAIIFFLIVSLNLYSSNKNKIIAQSEEIKAIQENYNKDLENIDEIYDNLVKIDLKTVFIKESSINSPNKVYYNLSEWTNENVVAKVSVYTENNSDAQLQVKVTSKRTGITTTYDNRQVDNNEVIITENSSVVVTCTDKEQNFELNKFDKIEPIVSVSPNKGNYVKANYSYKDISIQITASDLGGSGVDILQYAWTNSNITEPTSGWENFTNGTNTVISNSAGKYYLWTRVIDKAGNQATEVKKAGPFIVGGWQVETEKCWYYYDESMGEKLTGWQYLFVDAANPGNKYWYYLDPNNEGLMLTGWQLIEGYWYYFREYSDTPGTSVGEMTTGWQLSDGKWYYLKKEGDGVEWSGPTGSMLCGDSNGNKKVLISNKWYEFNAKGECLNP